jgi:hypothetical protein
MKKTLEIILRSPFLESFTPSQIGAVFFILFWLVTLAAVLMASRPIILRTYLALFFVLLILPGLAGQTYWLWPFQTWHLWGGIQARQAEFHELYVVDSRGHRYLYDRTAIPPLLNTQVHHLARELLKLPRGASADALTAFLLSHANARRAELLAGSRSAIMPTYPLRQFGRAWDAVILNDSGAFDHLLARRVSYAFKDEGRAIIAAPIEERLFP